MSSTTGVLYIHSAPSALCPHVDWAVGGVLGVPVSLSWTAQPAERGSHRSELSWRGRPGTANRLTAVLKGWEKLRFEVTEDAGEQGTGERYSWTPNLGIFQAVTGPTGDILVPEARIKKAVVSEALGGAPLALALDRLLGRPWDDELELFRQAGEGATVRWLHQVV